MPMKDSSPDENKKVTKKSKRKKGNKLVKWNFKFWTRNADYQGYLFLVDKKGNVKVYDGSGDGIKGFCKFAFYEVRGETSVDFIRVEKGIKPIAAYMPSPRTWSKFESWDIFQNFFPNLKMVEIQQIIKAYSPETYEALSLRKKCGNTQSKESIISRSEINGNFMRSSRVLVFG